MNQALTEVVEETNRRLQAAVAAQSSRGRLIVAEESGHNIPFDQPHLVLAAIRELVELHRREHANDGREQRIVAHSTGTVVPKP